MPSNNDLAKIHIAKKKLQLDDNTYQDILRIQCGGKETAKDLTVPQVRALLAHFKTLGWTPSLGKNAAPNKKMDQAEYAVSLWKKLGDQNKLRDPSTNGLRSFCKAKTGVEHVSWCDPKQKSHIINALVAWTKKEAKGGKE